MKLANISLSVLTVLLASSPAMSADLTVQGQLITSQGKLNSEKAEFIDPLTGAKVSEKSDGKADTITAPGAGVNLQYKLNDDLRLGGGVAWIEYNGDKDNADYSDLSASVNATYDFFKQDAFSLYGLGGVSYHMVDPKDQKEEGLKVTMKSADLLNYDLGVGGRYEVASNVNLGLSYRYSDTLAKGSIDASSAIGTESLKTTFKDVSLQQNELIASVGYSF